MYKTLSLRCLLTLLIAVSGVAIPHRAEATDLFLRCIRLAEVSVLLGTVTRIILNADNNNTTSGGPFDSSNTLLTLYYIGFTLEESSLPNGATQEVNSETSEVTIDLGTVLASADSTTEISLRATTLGTHQMQVALSGDLFDPDEENNECSTTVTVLPPLTTTSTASNPESGAVNDPISTFSGEFFKLFTPDIVLGGPMDLSFRRYYGSRLVNDSINASTLGDNWRHNFDWTISSDESSATVISDLGARITFDKDNTDWVQSGNQARRYQLIDGTQANELSMLDVRSQRIYHFDNEGMLSGVADGRGSALSLAYNVDNRLSQVSDGVGRTLTFTYLSGKIISVSDGNRAVGFSHIAAGIGSSTSTLNLVTQYSYDGDNRLTAVTLPAGNTPFTQSYDDEDRVGNQTDADGNVTTLAFEDNGLTTIDDPDGSERQHTHSAGGQLSNVQDAATNSVAFGYSAEGQRIEIIDALGNSTTVTYDSSSGLPVNVENTEGNSRTYTYQDRLADGFTHRDLTGVVYEDSTAETYTYDAMGNPLSHTDRGSNTSTFTYSGAQILSATNALGGVYTNTYNADGTLATHEDPAANITSYGYDAQRRLATITYADGAQRLFTYDADDRPLTVTNENGFVHTFTYDDNGNRSGIKDGLNNTLGFTYDSMDRLSTVVDAQSNATSRSYDSRGRIATETDLNGNTTSFGYDSRGRNTSWTDGSGQDWTMSHNDEDIITSITNPLGHTILFDSTTTGLFSQITSPLGHSMHIDRDTRGRIISTTDAMNGVTSFTRDNLGLVSDISLPDPTIAASVQRNAFGSITSFTDPNGGDWNRSFNNSGRKISRSDPLGNQFQTTYNNRQLPAQLTFPGGLGTITNSYDASGNLTVKTYSSGDVFAYAYDANNRLLDANGLTRSRDVHGRIDNSNGIVMTRDPGGRVVEMQFVAGKSITYSYDANDRMTTVSDWLGGTTSFSYDAAGNLVQVTRPNGVHTTQTWDDDERLASITQGTITSIELSRNDNGDVVSGVRTHQQVLSGTSVAPLTASYDIADRSTHNNYDAMGRLTADASRSFDWNMASQLLNYNYDGAATTAEYDGLNRLVRSTRDGMSTDYIWNDGLEVYGISIERVEAVDTRYYVHSPYGALLYSIDATDNSRRFYHFDELGNTDFISDDGGVVIAHYSYSPFGSEVITHGANDNPYTWRGESGVRSVGGGLYYMRARYYDGVNARFISPDPIRLIDPGKSNPYQYALNNPMSYQDAMGLYAHAEFDQIMVEGMQDKLDWINTRIESLEEYQDLDIGRRMMDEYRDLKQETEARLAAYKLVVESRTKTIDYRVTEETTVSCTAEPSRVVNATPDPTPRFPGSGGNQSTPDIGPPSPGPLTPPSSGSSTPPGSGGSDGSGRSRSGSPSVAGQSLAAGASAAAGTFAGGPIPTDLASVPEVAGRTLNELGKQNRRNERLGIRVEDIRCSQGDMRDAAASASEYTIVNLFTMSVQDWKEAYFGK